MNAGDIVVVKANCTRYYGQCNNLLGRVEAINNRWDYPIAVSFKNMHNYESLSGNFHFLEENLMVTKPVWKDEKSTIPEIKNVYFNDPVTVVMWNDGTKTIVRCSENDFYDPEKGLAMAIIKKFYGNDNSFHKIFKKWLPNEDDAEPVDFEDFFANLRRILLGKE